MGLHGRNHVYRFGRALAPSAIYPKHTFRDDGTDVEYEWGPSVDADTLYEDANGIFRAMKFCAFEQELSEDTPVVEEMPLEEGDEDPEAIQSHLDEGADVYQFGTGFVRPSHVGNFFIRRFLEFFLSMHRLRTIRFVMDYLGCTPKSKTITRFGPTEKPVLWPTDPDTLFTGDHRFRNNVNQLFADPKAKRLFYAYITHVLLMRFVTDVGFPDGACIIIYGAVWEGSDGCEMVVGKDAKTGLPYAPRPLGSWCPRAEADLVIRYLLNEHRATSNQLLISADSDFYPIILDVVKQKYHQDKNPDAYNIYWRSGLTYSVKLTRDDYMRTLLPPGVTRVNCFDKPRYDAMCKRWVQFYMENAPKPKKADKVVVVKDQFSIMMRRAVQIISMNEMFIAVWSRMYLTHGRCDKCCPIQTFAVLCFLAGCDYLPNLSFITFDGMMRVYQAGFHGAHSRCLCPFSDDRRVSLDVSLLHELICACYRALHPKVLTEALVPANNLAAFRQKLYDAQVALHEEARKKAASKQVGLGMPMPTEFKALKINYGRMPPEQGISSWMAAAHWTVNYYLYMHSGPDMPCWDPFKLDAKGNAVHGYQYQNERASFVPVTPLPATVLL